MRGTSDLLGHERTIARLWAALSRGTLHQAYLFEGPRGVGKGTLAHRLAMAANCTAASTATPATVPCGACASCTSIAAGTHPDVILVEPDRSRAAGTIPVDAIREVVRQTGYHRYGSRRRVVIIDPAEAMQDAAANALLKTLEEPPTGTGFILLATHAGALLPTIVSRCQRVRLGAVPDHVMADWLESKGHGLAQAAARVAQGCPGRALELVQGELERRMELRDRFLAVLEGDLQCQFDFAASLCRGKRQDWRGEVDRLLDVIEDLLRDASIAATGADLPLLNADVPDVVDRWAAALWPSGVTACADRIVQARDQLDLYVTGKTALDALITGIVREVRPAS